MDTFKTVLHHTCSDRNGLTYINENGPFSSINPKTAFLGFGFYFWDNHLELAKWWGNKHYNEKYAILECDNFSVNSDEFLDLVGKREHMILIDKMGQFYGLNKISEILLAMKLLAKETGMEGSFPYKAIRSIDTLPGSYIPENIHFVTGKEQYTTLNPKIIVCILEKKLLTLHNFNVIYPLQNKTAI